MVSLLQETPCSLLREPSFSVSQVSALMRLPCTSPQHLQMSLTLQLLDDVRARNQGARGAGDGLPGNSSPLSPAPPPRCVSDSKGGSILPAGPCTLLASPSVCQEMVARLKKAALFSRHGFDVSACWLVSNDKSTQALLLTQAPGTHPHLVGLAHPRAVT